MVEQSKHLGPWRRTLVDGMHASGIAGAKIDTPVFVGLLFYMPRPKYHYGKDGLLRHDAPKYHTHRPDVDKLARAVLDALTIAFVISDDSVVAELTCIKFYANADSGVRISISEFTKRGEPNDV